MSHREGKGKEGRIHIGYNTYLLGFISWSNLRVIYRFETVRIHSAFRVLPLRKLDHGHHAAIILIPREQMG